MKSKLDLKLNINWTFLVLMMLLIIENFLYLNDVYIPTKDSMYVFQIFYFFYNELFFHGELAQWMPYYSYGLPTNFHQLVCFTPISYLAFLWGWIFKITNVLWLFKVSILGEQLVFLLGMYLLSQRLFRERTTIFLVSLGAIASSYWLGSIYFHLRIFYLFPFAIHFLLLFLDEKKSKYFWMMAVTMAVWLMGVPPYFVSLWIFVFFVIIISYILLRGNIFRNIFKYSTINIVLFLTALAVGISYGYQLLDLKSFADTPTRPNLKNDLGIFLFYGAPFESQGHLTQGHYLNSFLLGQTPEVYIGLLPLALCFWALVRERRQLFLVFLSALIALIWLSFSGAFSTLCYHFFPGLSYYRHIDGKYLDGFIKIFILLCAGFGWEHFVKEKLRIKVGFLAVTLLGLIFVFDGSRVTADTFYALWLNQALFLKVNLSKFVALDSALFRISVYPFVIILLTAVLVFVRFYNGKRGAFPETLLHRAATILLIVVLLIDVVSFQYSVHKKVFQLPESYQPFLYAFQVHKQQFQEQRRADPELTELSFFEKKNRFESQGTVIPLTSRQKDAYEVIGRWDKWASSCVEAYNFLQLDSCYPQFRIDFQPRKLSTLLTIDSTADTSKILSKIFDLHKVFGCNAPKLRLVPRAFFADSIDEARKKINLATKTDDAIILQEAQGKMWIAKESRELLNNVDGSIQVKAFTANRLEADVDVLTPGGAWFYYADSYHSGWQAIVNGKKVPVYAANVAFKAVRLEKGKNDVQFIFRNSLSFIASHVIAFFGLVVSAAQYFVLFRTLFFTSQGMFV